MNKHFPVINKKATLFLCALVFVNIIISAICVSFVLTGGNKLFIIPLIVFVIFFFISIMILVSVLTAGIDVKNNQVIMADIENTSKGKQPQFNIKDLKNVCLIGCAEPTGLSNHKLVGAKIDFELKDGTHKQYYPIELTVNQYQNIKEGMLNMSSTINRK